eukprot:m.17284 g.17284  ORF g.17284 m.17284 type:complete len:398 (+) comp5430_c0_seq1:227-1420(+)
MACTRATLLIGGVLVLQAVLLGGVTLPCPPDTRQVASLADVHAQPHATTGVPHCACKQDQRCVSDCHKAHVVPSPSAPSPPPGYSAPVVHGFRKSCVLCTCVPKHRLPLPKVPPERPFQCTDRTLHVWTHEFIRFFGNKANTHRLRPLCRVPCACRLTNGTWVLPRFLYPHRAVLHHCGLAESKVVFVDTETASPNSNAGDPTDSSVGVDLLGVVPTREHFPHFFTDTLWMMLAYDTIFDQRQENRNLVEHMCATINDRELRPCHQVSGSTLGAGAGFSDSGGDKQPTWPRAAMIARHGFRHSTWVETYLAMLKRFGGGVGTVPVYLPKQNVKSIHDHQGCFNSVLVGDMPWWIYARSVRVLREESSRGNNSFAPDSIVFDANSLFFKENGIGSWEK